MKKTVLNCLVRFYSICFFSALILYSSNAAATDGDWFAEEKTVNFLFVFSFIAALLFVIKKRAGGVRHYIRSIKGLDALKDGVGRAAEMGKPVLYVPGISSISHPSTMASMTVLSSISEYAAGLRQDIFVPCYSPVVYPVAKNVISEAYLTAGKNPDRACDNVTYQTSRFLTFAMAVASLISKKKVAASFLIGHFYSESLILAETGASIGAMQIGATDSEAQLPFFIITCDHVIIGEELFAAAALLSDNPEISSTLVVHDWFKAAAIVMMLAGLLFGLLGMTGVELL